MSKEELTQRLLENREVTEPSVANITWETLTPFLFAARGLKGISNIKNLIELNQKQKVWGTAYKKGSKNPEKAISILKEKREGFVPNADNKGTDFVWGEYIPPNQNKKGGGFGLAHIEGRRNEQGLNGDEFLDTIPNLMENGNKFYKPNHPGRYYIELDNQEAIIRTDYNGKPWQWLNSVYFKNPNK